MIVVGLTGGMGQGKSTVGAKLRDLAGVDYKADLEFSYPISAVINDWMKTWPQPLVLDPDQTVEALANELLITLPPILEEHTGRSAEAEKLQVLPTDESRAIHERLLDYLNQWLGLNQEERAVQLPVPIIPANKALHRAVLQWLGGAMITLVHPDIWVDVISRRIAQLEGRGYSLLTVGGIRYPQDMEMIHRHKGIILKIVRPNTESNDDVTENAMQQVVADVELINNGTLAELEESVRRLWKDLSAGQPKPRYVAAAE